MKNKNPIWGILGDAVAKITVETDEKNPVTIAVITNENGIDVTEGYRVRLTPKYTD